MKINRILMKIIKIIGLIALVLLIGCQTTTTSNNPGQLITRAIETRYIEASYDIAFTSAAHAFFALGFTIHHSEKGAGIIEGDNTNPNIDAQRSQAALSMVPYIGIFAMFADTSAIKKEITLLLEKGPDDKRTKMRIQMVVNGKPQIDPKVVDAIWIVTQREAMMTSGVNVPNDIEKKYNALGGT